MTTSQAAQAVRELTAEGISAAKAYLSALRQDDRAPFQDVLLTDARYAARVTPEVYVERRRFANRREAGAYLAGQLAPLGEARVADNAPLWSWLGMFYFHQVVRIGANGNPRLGRNPDVAYVIDPDETGRGSRRHFAHRLLLSWEIYTRHGETAWYLLDEPVISLSHLADRLVGAPEMFRSVGIVDLAHRLYANPQTRELKPGLLGGGGNQRPAGGVVRLLDVLNQLYMTYDVYGMTAEQLLGLLPPEFDRFRPDTMPVTAGQQWRL